mgnify:CR=1 FL=1
MRKTFRQAVKYGVVGVGNTLLTMVVIYVMMKGLHCREGLSNITGYVAGLLNSFVWNKQWTFKESTTSWRRGVLRFAVAFAVCYLLQWSLVTFLNAHLDIDHYYNHLIGMAFYTVLNFVLNKVYTFKV